jgi:HAD superfamily hydrolase (TIGR01484 family)
MLTAQNYKYADVIIFDLDGTLSYSKSDLGIDMADRIVRLLTKKKVAILTGGTYNQIQNQFLRILEREGSGNLSNLFLFPTSGSSMYVYQNGKWLTLYDKKIPESERVRIIALLNEAISNPDIYKKPEKIYGEIIEDRGNQITFSGLGQKAPFVEKSKWDPDKKTRNKIIDYIRPKIGPFNIAIGGSTSIDITQKGMDKSFGIEKINQYMKIPFNKMIFVGDALGEDGNDAAVKKEGIKTISVLDPEETKKIIDKILESC